MHLVKFYSLRQNGSRAATTNTDRHGLGEKIEAQFFIFFFHFMRNFLTFNSSARASMGQHDGDVENY